MTDVLETLIEDVGLEEKVKDMEEELGLDISSIINLMAELDTVITKHVSSVRPDMPVIDGMAAIAMLLSSRYKMVVEDLVKSEQAKVRFPELYAEHGDNFSEVLQDSILETSVLLAKELKEFENRSGILGGLTVPLASVLYLSMAFLHRTKQEAS